LSHAEYAAFLAPLKRDAFVPALKQATDADDKASRYFGKPWMPAGMEWPKDGDAEMGFVLQLDLATVPWKPEGMPDKGLLLFFHAEEYSDPEEQSFITVVDTSLEGGLRDIPDGVDTTPSISIVGWNRTVDTPHFESFGEIEGIDAFEEDSEDFGFDENYKSIAEDGNAYDEDDLIRKNILPIDNTFSGDKIGGWPNWEQGDDTPSEPDGTRWTYFMQVGYDGFRGTDIDRQSVLWPTWGTGHIFVHAGRFMYIWACD
jgi:uncharacterized protein YwqG